MGRFRNTLPVYQRVKHPVSQIKKYINKSNNSITQQSNTHFIYVMIDSIFEALLIFWITAGIAVLMLQYGPGRSFYECLDAKRWTCLERPSVFFPP